MRSTLLALTCSILVSNTKAQEQHSLNLLPSLPKSEIGIFAQSDLSNNNENYSLVGLQYTKPISDQISIRGLFAYASYYNSGGIFATHSNNDTSLEKKTNTHINLGMAGLGMVMQRHFYKHVYLFAAVELRAGYGSGSNDSIIVKRFSSATNGSFMSEQVYNSGSASITYVGLAPSIGAKLQFNRITFGLELSGIDATYKSLKIANSATNGILDISTGKFNNRLFVNFRI